MLRLVCDEEGQVWPDVLRKAPGRGAYVCGECLQQRLHDKHLRAAWKGRVSGTGQADELRRRLAVALLHLCRQYVRRGRSCMNIGRDAVMHRMWGKTPMLVMLATDAGEALKRQIGDACARRECAGLKTVCSSFGDSALLAGFLEVDKLSVLAMDDTRASKKWRQYCMWYDQLLMKPSLLNTE